jgi:tetratricopeptide (TPR) repeat protein
MLHHRAVRLWERAEHEAAETHARRALASAPVHGGPALKGVADRLNILLTLARFASELTNHAQADERLSEAIHILREVTPSPHRDLWLSEVLVRVGNTARLSGDFEAASVALREAKRLVHSATLNSVRQAGVENALGILAKDTGRYSEAADHYSAAMQLLPGAHKPHAAWCASLHHNLAGLSYAQGQYNRAEESARRALQLRPRTSVADRAAVAADLSVLGAALTGQGRFDEAEIHIEHALDLWTRLFGPEHYETAVNLHNLAAVQQARGELAAAEESLTTALTIKTRVLGDAHPEVKTLQANLRTVRELRDSSTDTGKVIPVNDPRDD